MGCEAEVLKLTSGEPQSAMSEQAPSMDSHVPTGDAQHTQERKWSARMLP